VATAGIFEILFYEQVITLRQYERKIVEELEGI